MATTYGPIEGRLSVGINVSMSPSTVTSSTSSVTITWTVYARSDSYGFNDPQTMTMSNAMSATANYTMVSGTVEDVVKQVWSSSQSVSTSFSGTVTKTLTAAASGLFNGGTPSHTRSITIPKRPYANPPAPSAVTSVRNSDTQATISWTRNPTTEGPYTSLTVQRARKTGDNAWEAWTTVASTSSTATSYVDAGLSTNNEYKYQVRANNSAGSSSYVAAAASVKMTPTAPSSVVAAGINNGAQIKVDWVNAAYSSSTITWTVQRSVNGGAYANVTTGIAQGTLTWTDPTPGAGTNTYRVAAVQSEGALTGPYTTSNTVSTIVVPLAPTNLAPTGIGVDLSQNVTLTWQHNHAGDGLAQSQYSIRYSTNGGGAWTTYANAVASSVSSAVLTGGTIANGSTVLWQVSTRGSTTVATSPWSASATITGSAAPTATLTAGYPPAALSTLPLEVRWSYNQDQLSPQAAWEAVLYASDGTTVLQSASGQNADTSMTFSYPLVNNVDYVVKVRVRSGAGVWSAWSSQAVAFDLLPPADPILTVTYQECTGTMLLNISAEADVPGVTVPAVSATIERRVAGGEWVTLFIDVPLDTDLLDTLPLTRGLNEYRATTASVSPSYAVGDVVPAYGTDGASGSGMWAFLSYGDGFTNVLRVRNDLDISVANKRVRAVQHFLGRTKPVLLMGTNTEKVLSLSGSLNFDATCRRADDCYYDSPPVDWEAASDNAELVCYRDFTGRRIFGMLGGVDVKDVLWPGQASLSFSVTEAEYNEFYGLPIEAVEPVNLLSDENSSFEGGTTGDWGTGYLGAPASVSITSDLTRSTEGLRALKVVFPTAAAGCGPQLGVTGLDVGKSYVATFRAYIPAATPHVRFGNPFGGTSNADTTIKDQWQTLSISWSGRASVYLVPKSLGATTAGMAAWFDDFRVYEV